MLLDNPILGALAIFFIRVLSIGLATVRLLIMGRSKKLLVAFIAFFEALSFALTFGMVARDLTNIWNLGAYSLGFSAGTWVGMLIEEQVGMGFATVTVVSRGKSLPIVEAIHNAGFGATRSAGEGTSGSVGFVWVVVRRRNVDQVIQIAQSIDEGAFITVNETRSVRRGFLGYGRS